LQSAIKLEPVYEVPSYSFFVWGFVLQKRLYPSFISYFGLREGNQRSPIKLLIGKAEYDASVELIRMRSKNFPSRDQVRIMWRSSTRTQKALRKLFMYSYATTISKGKPSLKELMLLEHLGENRFALTAIGRQKTDFDAMFNFMEDKNLFEYWKDYREKGESKRIFVDFQRKWLDVKELDQFRNRSNVIYMLCDSKARHLYIGQAARFGSRVKEGKGRVGLSGDWDMFKFFEIHPDYGYLLDDFEAFLIGAMASVAQNEVKVTPLNDANLRLVNRQLILR
jgi:hypothetical protein